MECELQQLKKLFWCALGVFWSFAAYAAQSTFSSDITSIPIDAIVTSMVLAVIGGFAYTLKKISDTTVVLKSVPLEIVKDIFTSMVVGMVAFCGGTLLHWDSLLTAIVITIGGYGGSRTLEPGLAALIEWISRLGAKRATDTDPTK